VPFVLGYLLLGFEQNDGYYGCPNLDFNGILSRAHKGFDVQVDFFSELKIH
jgi:hypothetical protein